uniref:Uncharacterized protein n=1 Tax=Sphaerodactylus townsendi TaxID=933632 RepID=A0ACB8G6J1_9SAUR
MEAGQEQCRASSALAVAKCTCQNRGAGCVCDRAVHHCLPGWTAPVVAPLLSEDIPKGQTGKILVFLSGRYGKKCAVPCKCANHSICHPVDGSCDCAPGWTGSDCSRHLTLTPDRLPVGFLGEHTHPCQCWNEAACNPETGRCLCPSAFTGAHCETRTGSPDNPFTMVPAPPTGGSGSSLGAVIGIVIMAALLVLVLALFVYYRHWQKGKENQHFSVAYTTGRTNASEYAVPDIPPSYAHYYSNPSYHTLSPCSPSLPVPSIPEPPAAGKLSRSQPFPTPKSTEQDWPGLYGADCNATLPADWKHQGSAPALSHAGLGGSQIDRSYSYTNGLGKHQHRGCIKEESLCRSDSSLSSENPYATIKDLPVLAGKPSEGSYMEMRHPAKRERAYAESSLFEEPAQCLEEEEGADGLLGAGGLSRAAPDIPPNHYDSPKNSHIPSHYDVPPVRHYSPSPPRRRRDR